LDDAAQSMVDGLKCVNCGKNHSSGYRGCEAYLMQKEILQFKTIHRTTFADAANAVKNVKMIQVDKVQNQNLSTAANVYGSQKNEMTHNLQDNVSTHPVKNFLINPVISYSTEFPPLQPPAKPSLLFTNPQTSDTTTQSHFSTISVQILLL